jgi:hypothetical protein
LLRTIAYSQALALPSPERAGAATLQRDGEDLGGEIERDLDVADGSAIASCAARRARGGGGGTWSLDRLPLGVPEVNAIGRM